MNDLADNLRRLAKWCQAQDPLATIYLHAIEAADFIEQHTHVSTPPPAGDDLVERLLKLERRLSVAGWDNQLVAEARAALETREGEIERWQPIESAPEDGSEILLAVNNGWDERQYVTVGRREGCGLNGEYEWLGAKGRLYGPVQPTHWRSLPDPPRQALNKGTDNVG